MLTSQQGETAGMHSIAMLYQTAEYHTQTIVDFLLYMVVARIHSYYFRVPHSLLVL